MAWSRRALAVLAAACLATTPLPARASFSLDDVKQDYWYYVHNHLADTTSPECLAAYAAPIECDETLLGVVSSNSPNFNPGPDDLERTCTTACSDALDTYVDNVRNVCTAPGDGALVSTRERPRPTVGVDVVGEIFRYRHAWLCSKNSTGWCYFNYSYDNDPYYASSDFPCDDGCALRFMGLPHDYPAGSNYIFRVYDLEELSSWWKDTYSDGWDTVQECRSQGDGGSDDGDGEVSTTSAPSLTTCPYSHSVTPTTSTSTIPEKTATTTSSQDSGPMATGSGTGTGDGGGGGGTGAGARLGREDGNLAAWAVSASLLCGMLVMLTL